MSSVVDKFLRYISYDTESMDDAAQLPSTEKQFVLANVLAEELKAMGASEVQVSSQCYVTAVIPSNTERSVPALGLIAHMDTSPAFSGCGVKPQIVKDYDGSSICLNEELGLILDPAEFPELTHYVGKDLITTDGTTLLGADDKAGVAEIMAAAQYLLTHPEIKHGKICIGFTPDEEVGRGTDGFDVAGFGADVAYTVDGGALGELEYENFNAAGAKVHIHGKSIHPGSSKGTMKNAILIGMEFQSMLPAFENPMYTEGYEGFYHLDHMNGDVENTELEYIIRDHDSKKFAQKKHQFIRTADFLNMKYGIGTVEVDLKDSYYNMKEKIEPHMYLIDLAQEAMRELDIQPKVCPIRGGTDGARLSYMGLPCPNLCTGGHNFHGKYEYVCIQSMEKIVQLLISIVSKFEAR
ncbi:MAG: peptidase T [Lachnospiraceae bacterium]|nr:peptidase T [Lachnospiraceae bacterium]MDO5551529.1 peptidase T [Lachnospiraceae bacterium]